MGVRRMRRLRSSATVMAAVAMFISSMVVLEPGGSTPAAAAPAAPAAPIARDPGGRWGPVEDWPMVAIHAALDSNGRVVTYGTNPDGKQTGQFIYDIWTPSISAAAGHNTLANTTRTDLFCNLQLNRADTGDMIMFGGDNWTGVSTNNRGNPDITQINAQTGALTRLPGMNRSRWYATGTTMPDGSIYVQGGLDGEDRPERWTPERGAELLPIDTSNIDWYYPRNFVVPDGRIFGIANDRTMYYISESMRSIEVVGQLPNGYGGNWSTAVMFEPGRILLFGGATTQAIIIDVTGGGAPVITNAGKLSTARRWLDGTLLPDGRVLATGGSIKSSTTWFHDPIETYGSNLTAEIWDPRTNQWTVGDAAQIPRLYHSTALLLPDGRVLTAGGGAPGPITNTDAELYYPDYFTRADGSPMPRPQINRISDDTLTVGQQLSITVPEGSDISRVTLVKSGSVTHAFNMDQRFVELDFAMNRDGTGGDQVITRLPASNAVVTPGYYLLSVLDGNGIPSRSELVKVEASDPAHPTDAVDGEIVRLYHVALQRLPEAQALAYWRQQLLNGVSVNAVADVLIASPEFSGRYGQLGNAAFVDALYRNVLGRAPTGAEREYWLGRFAIGATRTEIVVAFANSAELRNRTGTAGLPPAQAPPAANPNPPAPVTDPGGTAYRAEIRRLYLGSFGREPDQAGLDYWVGIRSNGLSLVAVANEFAASAEVRARFGATSNGQFVDVVYRNVLGRPADTAGRQYWLRQLAAGVTRGTLMVSFTESPENVARVG